MSIQIVEIAQPSVIATVAVAQPSTVAVVEVRQGPAGESGTDFIDAATGSDGTANLSLLNVTTATAEVTGTLTAPHIHGNLAGSLYAHVRAGEDLAKGDPVYVSGSHGSGATLIAEVSKADASNAAKMPAVGIMDAAVSANANGHMVVSGTINDLATNAYAINAELYVAAGGGMTATPPSARAQPVARVERSNANNGAILVKVNGLSASDATANTLVRRTSDGGASFGPLSATALSGSQNSISSSAGTTITGPLTLSGSSSDTLAATYNNTITLTGTTGVTIAGGPLAITQTWNNAATTFTGLQVNITDTASNAASLLMDLRVGGLSKFLVKKSGGITTTTLSNTANQSLIAGVNFGTNGNGSTIYSANLQFGDTSSAFKAGVSSNGFYIGRLEAPSYLVSEAANTLAQRNGTGLNPQTFRLYNTFTSATEFERLNLRWDANVAKIGTEKGSAGGVARDLVLETDGTERVRVGATSGTVSIAAAGSASAPSLNFGDASTGIYKQSADRMGFTAAGSLKAVVYSSGMYMNTGAAFGINTANWFRIGTSGVELTTTATGGTLAPLTVSNLTASGDIEATDSTKGVILKSPDGTRYRVTVANGGALTTTAL